MAILVGVELGEEYLKIAVAKRKGIQSKLLECFIEKVSSLDDVNISLRIMEFLKTIKHKSKFVFVSLPRNFVTVRNLHLPSQDEGEIVKMIELYISRIVPYKKEEVVFGYRLAGIDELDYARIMLAIVHKEIIKRQIKILDSSGFLVDRITLSSCEVWRYVCNQYRAQINPADIYLILDINATFTDFIVFNLENVFFSRSISIKAKELAGELGRKKFLGEIRQSLLIFYNEEINKKPAKLFLNGGISEELSKIVESELEIETVYIGNKFVLQTLKDKEIPSNCSLTAVTQLSLGDKDRGFSFILPEIEIRKSIRERTRELIILGSLIIYFLGVVSFIFLERSYNLKFYLERLKKQKKEVEKKIDDLFYHIDRIEFVKNYLKKRKIPLFIIYQLQKVIPDSIAVSFLSINQDTEITLRGKALQLSDVFRLINEIEKLKYFKDVQTKYTRKRRLKDKEITDFEIVFFLNKIE